MRYWDNFDEFLRRASIRNPSSVFHVDSEEYHTVWVKISEQY